MISEIEKWVSGSAKIVEIEFCKRSKGSSTPSNAERKSSEESSYTLPAISGTISDRRPPMTIHSNISVMVAANHRGRVKFLILTLQSRRTSGLPIIAKRAETKI